MTNEEAIEILQDGFHFRSAFGIIDGSNALFMAINSLKENTKFKAEIEQLKKQRETRIKVSEANFNIYSKLEIERDNLVAEIEQLKEDSKIVAKELVTQIREIDKLKSELEQSDSCDGCKYDIDRNEYYCDGCKRMAVDNFETERTGVK